MLDVVDACAPLRRFARAATSQVDDVPHLRWVEEWRAAAGRGVVVGLFDTGCDPDLIDLVGANLIIHDFTRAQQRVPKLIEHGTFSVMTLIGQGHRHICGIAPRIRLLVAAVVEPDGIAEPNVVAAALAWLIAEGAQIVAMPLGDPIDRQEIVSQLEQGAERGMTFFAAAGNCYPQTLLFPARHPTVIAVGAAADDGTLLPLCNRQPRLDVVAPGQQIASLIREGVIHNRSGSSVACVIAAGVAALALSAMCETEHLPCPAHLLSLICAKGTNTSKVSTQMLEGRCASRILEVA